jgi:prepilin-type N-terminal cleavage/methylation domain-containing protein
VKIVIVGTVIVKAVTVRTATMRTMNTSSADAISGRDAIMARIRRRSAARGFTLVELLVALAAGIAVATAAYTLSKTSMDVFNQETRISTAQFNGTIAMNRLLADIQRAGFMMSPNIENDPTRRCDPGAPTWSNLRALQVLVPGQSTEISTGSTYTSRAGAQVTGNGYAPKLIRMAGNYSTTELFRIRAVNGSSVGLQVLNGSFDRVWNAFSNEGGPSIQEIFGCDTAAPTNCIGRYVRLTDTRGKESFRRVEGVTVTLNGSGNADRVDIQLDANPPGDESCGVAVSDGFSQGTINPISIIEYEIVSAPTTLGGAWGTADGLTAVADEAIRPVATVATDPIGDLDRSELIRRELVSPDDSTLNVAFQTSAATTFASEVVAEFAVNLDVAARVRTSGTATAVTLAAYNFGDDTFAIGGPNEAAPESYVSMQVLLSVRTRAPDRDEALTCAAPDPIMCPGIGNVARGRFDLFPGGGPIRRFARVRTVVQEIGLPNIAGSLL